MALGGSVVVGGAPKGVNGRFEVTNLHTGRVYHSKMNGDGYLDTDASRLAWVTAEIKEDMRLLRESASA